MKLDRAQTHLNTIHASALKFSEGELRDSLRVSKPDLSNGGTQLLRWEGVVQPDPTLGAMLGDFVHNVRSALDQLVWRLVLANWRKARHTHTQFPTSETDGKWRDDVTHRSADRGLAPTHGLSEQALALVMDYQPFRLGKKRRSKHTLLTLTQLSNEDKHRTLHVAAVLGTRGFSIWFEPRGYLSLGQVKYATQGRPIENGAEVARVRLLAGSAWPPPEDVQVHMQFSQGVDIGFYVEDRLAITVGGLPAILSAARSLSFQALFLPELRKP